MLFDKETAATTGQAARPEAVLGTGFWFDWTEQHYLMDAGSPVEVTGTGALKAWVNLVVRTKRDRYPIYPLDFGAPAQELIGRKYPKGYKLSGAQAAVFGKRRLLPGHPGSGHHDL